MSQDITKKSPPFFNAKSEYPQPAEWVMLAFTSVLCFFYFLKKDDLLTTTQHSMALISCFKNGSILSFYQICMEQTLVPAAYSIIIYGIFAVWNLPTALLFKFFGRNINFENMHHVGICTYWNKLLLLILALLSAWVIYKIALEAEMHPSKARWAAYLFLASPVTLFTVDIIGQYDIIMLTLLLFGVLFYIREQKRLFLLMIAFAIPCGPIAVFAFIPMVLLAEKRILNILKNIGIGFSVWLLTSLVFIIRPGYKETAVFAIDVFYKEKVLNNGLISRFVTLPIIIFVMIFACVYAYKTNIENKEKRWRYAVYAPLVTFSAVLTFIEWEPHWWIIIMPFLMLNIIYYKKFKLTTLCALGFSVFYMFTTLSYFINDVDQHMINHSLIVRWNFFGYSNVIAFQTAFRHLGLMYPKLFSAIMAAFLVVLLYLFFPSGKKLMPEKSKHFFPEKSAIYLYHLSLYMYILPTLVLYYWEFFSPPV